MKKWIIIAVILVVVVFNSAYVVVQTEQALILQFGDPVKVVNGSGKNDPGLKWKTPFIQDVVKFDKRILHLHAESRNFNTSGEKGHPDEVVEGVEEIAADEKVGVGESRTSRIIVDAYAKYKIIDPLKFYQTVETEYKLNTKLDSILESNLRSVIGKNSLKDLLTNKRNTIMGKVKDNVNKDMKSFGVDVVDVRIKRADLPPKNYLQVVKRMRAVREKEARELRAKGAEESQRIKSKAEKERTILIANAKKTSQELRGDGDAIATKVTADAFGKDKEFYSFYRSMEAYRNSLKKEDTSMVLSPDGEFLRFFGNKLGTRKK